MIFPPLGKVTSAVVKATVIAAVFNLNGTLSATSMVNTGEPVLIVPPSFTAALADAVRNLSVEVAML